MRTFVILSLLAATAALAPTAAAAPDLPDIGETTPIFNDCNGNNACVIVRDDPCVGVGLGLQGVMGCAHAETGCAVVYIGFNRNEVCTPPVTVRGLPTVDVWEHGACVSQWSSGTTACAYYDGSEDLCVLYQTETTDALVCQQIVDSYP